MSRGNGIFSVKDTNAEFKANTMICNKHIQELGTKWSLNKKHFVKVAKKNMCSIPENIIKAEHEKKITTVSSNLVMLQKHHAKFLLEHFNILFHVFARELFFKIKKKKNFINNNKFISTITNLQNKLYNINNSFAGIIQHSPKT